MDGFQTELLRRLPLVEAVFTLFSHVASEELLAGVFDRHRGRCYEKELSFPALVYLVADALVQHRGSGRQSLRRAELRDELPTSKQAAYGKLGRVPVAVSAAFLAATTAALREALPPAADVPVPASLAAFEAVAVDGKKLKQVARRLKLLRGLRGGLLGGKVLAALHVRTGQCVAMSADEDGERNDVPLVPALLPRVRERVPGAILWVADCQFVDLTLPGLFAAGGGHYLLRYTRKIGFHPDPARPAVRGTDRDGRAVTDEWGWLGSGKDGRRLYVRRVTLHRPGEDDVAVVTDLLDAAAYPAQDLLDLYLRRWGIECMFQQVVELFDLRRLIGGTPRATIFQAALCLLLYNLAQAVRAFVAEAAGRDVGTVSAENLFYDARRQLISWSEAGDASHTAAYFAAPPPTPEAARGRVRQVLTGAWSDLWAKSPPKTRRPPTPQVPIPGGHTSVHRVLEAHRAAVPAARPAAIPEATERLTAAG